MTSKAHSLHAMVASLHPRMTRDIHDGCLKAKVESVAARAYSSGHAIHTEIEVAIKSLDAILNTLLQSMKPFLHSFGAPDPDLADIAHQVLDEFEQQVLDEFRRVNQDRFTVSEYAGLAERILEQELGEFRSRARRAISDMVHTVDSGCSTCRQDK